MYVSGRTVKSTVTRPSTLAQATSATRAVARHTVGTAGLTFATTRGYDPERDRLYFATAVTFAEGTDVADFAALLGGSAGVYDVVVDPTRITVYRHA